MNLNRILKLCVVALACANATLLIGQTGGGSVVGAVHDSSGAVIPKATVTLTNGETGTTLTTQASSAGEYAFPVVSVGTYTVTVSAPGFGQTRHQGVIVPLGKTVTVDVGLQVGAATATVQVQALTAQLETETTQASTTIDQKTFDDLPISLNGYARSATSVADLMPGVADTPAIGYGTTGPQGQMYSETINGGQAWLGSVIYDGIPMVSAGLPGDYRQQAVPVEALQEFSLVQNSFSPEFSRTPGGVLTYSTRAGTNGFHGQAYEYLRNNDLDSAGYFATSGAPPLHQNEFGVNVGGPIILPHIYNGKNKLFFFAFYSGFRLAAGVQPALSTIPTIAERTGDFTGLVNGSGQQVPIYDPTTTACDQATGVCTRQQYQYNGILNVIPPSSISTAGAAYVTYLPQPSNSSLTNNFVAPGVNDAVENRFGGRVDYNLGTKDQIHGFFSMGPSTSELYTSVFLPPIDTYGAGISPNHLALARLGEDHAFSANMLLHLGFGFNRDTQNSESVHTQVVTYGITGGLPVTPQIYCNPGVCQYASTSGTGGSTYDEYAAVGNGFLSWTKGKQQFKIGAEFNKNGGNSKNLDTVVDALNPLETSYPGVAASGDAFASMMAGAFDKVTLADYAYPVDSRFQYFAAYFSDDYKIIPNLVINLGIRYEIPWTGRSVNNVFSGFEPDYPNPQAGGINGALVFAGHGQYTCNCTRLANTRFILWQPRVGLAYKLNDKMVIHAGYGIFAGANGDTFGTRSADGFNANASFQSVNNGITPAMYSANGYPSFTPPPFISPGFDNNGSINWDPKSAGLVGIIQNYTLVVQRELPHGFLLDVGYVGNTAQHLGTDTYWPDQIPIGYIAEYGDNALSAPLSSPLGQSTGVATPYAGFTGTVSQALRAFPQYQHVQPINATNGNSNYNSFQVKLQRQFHNGLSVLTSYTWGRIFGNAEIGIGQVNDGPQDSFNPQAETAPDYTEPPQTVAISYVYDLPFGTNRRYLNHGIAGAVLGGWGVSGIHHYQSGVPYFELASEDNLPIANYYVRPNYVPGQSERGTWSGKFNPYTDFYVNPNGFVQPPPNTYGNSARNIGLRSFGYYDEALSARKDFHIYESANLEFRTDWFNAFNRVNFGSISGAGTTNPGIAANFGTLNAQGNLPRSIQFALKLLF